MSKIDLTKPVQTREGLKATVVATDLVGVYPVLAIVTQEDGRKTSEQYTSEGIYYSDKNPSPLDLINAPRTFKCERWIVAIATEDGVKTYSYWVEPDLSDDVKILAIKRVVDELVEGEGLKDL